MEHLGLPDLAWLRKIIVERALTRGDYVLSGGARSDYYIDKFSLFSDPLRAAPHRALLHADHR